MVNSKWNGNAIKELPDETWIYTDTNQKVSENKNRSCGNCGKSQTTEGHDGCIGTLPDVFNACCGHGSDDEAYIQFNNGLEIRGDKAIEYIKGGRV